MKRIIVWLCTATMAVSGLAVTTQTLSQQLQSREAEREATTKEIARLTAYDLMLQGSIQQLRILLSSDGGTTSPR